MRTPTLTKPRFPLANRAAMSVLKELGNPKPPIALEHYIIKRNWEIHHLALGGPDGGMVKFTYRNKSCFYILVATDQDPDTSYDEETIRRRRMFTLAHELGHILLHGSFIVDSRDLSYLSEETVGILEVEANWFASRILMPNYAFDNLTDLLPDQLATKFDVNITPAKKRLKNLGANIRESLVRSARMDKWPDYIDYAEFPHAAWRKNDKWSSYEEAAASSEILYVCKGCGLLHNERTLVDKFCMECEDELVKVK